MIKCCSRVLKGSGCVFFVAFFFLFSGVIVCIKPQHTFPGCMGLETLVMTESNRIVDAVDSSNRIGKCGKRPPLLHWLWQFSFPRCSLGLAIVDGGNERDNLTYDRVPVQILSYIFQA